MDCLVIMLNEECVSQDCQTIIIAHSILSMHAFIHGCIAHRQIFHLRGTRLTIPPTPVLVPPPLQKTTAHFTTLMQNGTCKVLLVIVIFTTRLYGMSYLYCRWTLQLKMRKGRRAFTGQLRATTQLLPNAYTCCSKNKTSFWKQRYLLLYLWPGTSRKLFVFEFKVCDISGTARSIICQLTSV